MGEAFNTATTRSTIEYAYDAVGNRIRLTTGAGTTLYDFDVNDSLVAASGFGAAVYTYDAAGRLTRVDAGLG